VVTVAIPDIQPTSKEGVNGGVHCVAALTDANIEHTLDTWSGKNSSAVFFPDRQPEPYLRTKLKKGLGKLAFSAVLIVGSDIGVDSAFNVESIKYDKPAAEFIQTLRTEPLQEQLRDIINSSQAEALPERPKLAESDQTATEIDKIDPKIIEVSQRHQVNPSFISSLITQPNTDRPILSPATARSIATARGIESFDLYDRVTVLDFSAWLTAELSTNLAIDQTSLSDENAKLLATGYFAGQPAAVKLKSGEAIANEAVAFVEQATSRWQVLANPVANPMITEKKAEQSAESQSSEAKAEDQPISINEHYPLENPSSEAIVEFLNWAAAQNNLRGDVLHLLAGEESTHRPDADENPPYKGMFQYDEPTFYVELGPKALAANPEIWRLLDVKTVGQLNIWDWRHQALTTSFAIANGESHRWPPLQVVLAELGINLSQIWRTANDVVPALKIQVRASVETEAKAEVASKSKAETTSQAPERTINDVDPYGLIRAEAMNPHLLEVIKKLAQKYNFAITDAKSHRPYSSLHPEGNAIDVGGAIGINGQPFGYGGHSDVLHQFIKDIAALLPRGVRCEIGVPNASYAEGLSENDCYVFVDIGNGAHVHFGTRA
jgi:hypothetical protein